MEKVVRIEWKKEYAVKVSDYVIAFIERLGVDRVFCVTGGGAMHLNNSLGSSDKVQGVFMLHEQGASIAAESYARIREGYGVCMVTSGPGATNAITGLCGAYMDSIPVIFISGQAKRADLVGEQGIRQFGIQEVDIVSLVEKYTKYAVQITNPDDVRYELEKAAEIAREGRPGAVWIDIPLDVQASQVEPDELRGYLNTEVPMELSDCEISEVIEHFNKSNRPAIILGNGIRLSHAIKDMRRLIDLLGCPVFTSWNGVDLIEDTHPLFYGRPNIVGHRSANIILQNADFVLSLGTRLSILNTGYNYSGFLKKAFHVMVDIDKAEMSKKSICPQLKIQCDVGLFMRKLISRERDIERRERKEWMAYCSAVKQKYPIQIKEQEPRKEYVSLYTLFDLLSDKMEADDIYQFTSSGTTVDIGMKMLRLKQGQRAFLNKSMAAMGYDVPACIGSCIGSGGKRTICVTGDGSVVMNIQELEVVRRLNLPIKLFIADNQGYSMIWHSQMSNFDGKLTGCTVESGLTLPNMKKLAEAFGLPTILVEREEQLEEAIDLIFGQEGPMVCVINADISQKVLPKQGNYINSEGQMASRPIEDMVPLLDRDELENVTLR